MSNTSKNGSTFDLATLDTSAAADEGADMPIEHPASGATLLGDDGNAVTLRLAGSDSSRFDKAKRKAINRRLQRRNLKMTAEESDAEGLELLVECTLGWSENLVLDGSPLTFSAGNARKLYERLPWLREQADAFMGDRANFLPSSGTS